MGQCYDPERNCPTLANSGLEWATRQKLPQVSAEQRGAEPEAPATTFQGRTYSETTLTSSATNR